MEQHVQACLECQLCAVFILTCGRDSNAVVSGIVLGGADCGVNVPDTLEL